MTLTFTSGSKTTTSSESNFFDVTADRFFGMWVYLHNMTASETFRIKVYSLDSNTSTMRVYSTYDISGVQADPAFFIPMLPDREYKVTIQRTGGSDRAVTWKRIEVS